MTQPNNQFYRVEDGPAGATASPTHDPGTGKEFPVMMTADPSGHIEGSLPGYLLAVPPSAVGANKVHVDIFNAVGSGTTIRLRGIWVSVVTDVAVTGTLGARLDHSRTNTVGTGGTAATYNGTATNAPNITPMDPNNPAVPAQVSARNAATGGANTQSWMFPTWHFTEETNAGSQISQFFNVIPEFPKDQALMIREGFGYKIQQGTVNTVGSLAFLIAFTME